MLDLHFIREHHEQVAEALRKRHMDPGLDRLLEVDHKRRSHLQEVEALKKTRNDSSRKIGDVLRQGGDATALKEEVRKVGARIAELDNELVGLQEELQSRMLELPNMPHESVPEGKTEEDNRVERSWGEPPAFPFEAKPHWDLGTELGILDFERAAKISGARFALYIGAGARLERALIQFMMELHTNEHGYIEVLPPFMVHAQALIGTGQLPKFAEDLFHVTPGDFYLVPTAEVPVTNIHSDEILDGERLPFGYCASTPCFRSEAGSHGKDVRGLIRQHQFNKIEMVRFCRPEESYQQLELLTSHAEEVLKRLGLHHRVVTLSTGDLGFSSAKTYDLEVWLPAQRLFREISSCSNFEAFQARRAKIRYRPAKGGKATPLHTLNGSGLAVGRTLVAVLENYQQEDGSIAIPEVLQPYMGGMTSIPSPR